MGGVSDERVEFGDARRGARCHSHDVGCHRRCRRVCHGEPGESAPTIIEVDLLDLDSPNGGGGRRRYFLEYRLSAIHLWVDPQPGRRNDFAQKPAGQFRTADIRLFREQHGGMLPPDATMVSWLPFYHDMGLVFGVCVPVLSGISVSAHEPGVVPAATSPVDAHAGQQSSCVLRRHRTSPSTWRHAKYRTTTWPGLISGGVSTILSGSERVQPATLQRFADRFARFNLRAKVLRPSYGLAEATVYMATSEAGSAAGNRSFRIRETDRRPREAVRERERHAAGQLRCAAVTDGAHRRSRDRHRVSGGNGR